MAGLTGVIGFWEMVMAQGIEEGEKDTEFFEEVHGEAVYLIDFNKNGKVTSDRYVLMVTYIELV